MTFSLLADFRSRVADGTLPPVISPSTEDLPIGLTSWPRANDAIKVAFKI